MSAWRQLGCCSLAVLLVVGMALWAACSKTLFSSPEGTPTSFSLHHAACTQPRLFLMRFFRDVSRHKARKRLNHDSALTTIILGHEEILQVRDHDESGDSTSFTMTPDELATMNGEDGRPLYLAICGRIYDVTSGKSFYGKGRSYFHFVGRDASRAFATGCTQPACLVPNLDGLSSEDLKEVNRWVELYEFHDKYTYVGRLVSADPVSDAVAAAMREEEALRKVEHEVLFSTNSEGEPQMESLNASLLVDAFVEKGFERYSAGAMAEALMFWTASLTRLGSITEGGASFDGAIDSQPDSSFQDSADTVAAIAGGIERPETGFDFWIEKMLQRADILSNLAAASQKIFTRESLEEALNRYSEALGIVSSAIDAISSEEISDRSEACALGRAWLVRARIAGDQAATRVMLRAVLRRKNAKDLDAEKHVLFNDEALATFAKAESYIFECTENEPDGSSLDLLTVFYILRVNTELNFVNEMMKSSNSTNSQIQQVADRINMHIGALDSRQHAYSKTLVSLQSRAEKVLEDV